MKSLLIAFSLLFTSSFGFSTERLKTDIVDTAVSAGHFQTLVAAVDAAKLVDALKSPGPFTVFAPLDQAFAKLPEGSVEYLLENIPALTKLLTYHVVPAEIRIDQLAGQRISTLVEGQSVKVTQKGKMLYVNDAKILKVIPVKNGTIVVIDTVLRPF
jgi:uncharacterized surface protein with fasciclin (FAS1) repeats